jgi:flagellar hook-associated protein 3 FlgL
MSNAFRITQRSVSTTMMNGLQGNLGRMQRLQEQLSSGKQLSRPSDSPVKTIEALQFRSTIQRTEDYVRNAEDGLALLSTADSAVSDGLDLTKAVRDLVLRGMDDSQNAEGRHALATEVEVLRDTLVGIANTRYLDRPVFGGDTALSSAFGPGAGGVPGGSYVGDGGQAQRTVAEGVDVPVTVPGTEIFGRDTDPDQIFTVLHELSVALRADTPAVRHASLQAGLGRLDSATDRIISKLGEIGARVNRVETVKHAAEGALVALANSLAEVEDIDLPKTIVDLQMQEVAYKAALGATARVVQPSLLDFLR